MSEHIEFPELTPDAKAALDRGSEASRLFASYSSERSRAFCQAFLREAMSRAQAVSVGGSAWQELAAIADNLRSPLPPPPTLAEARAANLHTAEGKATVSAFLETLGEGAQ